MQQPPQLDEINAARDYLRRIETKLDNTPRSDPARPDLSRHVHEWRGWWRQSEERIGKRLGGMAVGNSQVDPLDMAKLSSLTTGYRKAAERNTGKPISADLANFEARIRGTFGLDPTGSS